MKMAPKRGVEPPSPQTSRTALTLKERVIFELPSGTQRPSWVCSRVSVRKPLSLPPFSSSRWAQDAVGGWLTDGMIRRDRWKPGFRDLCVCQFRHFGVSKLLSSSHAVPVTGQ
jgi:hypothetical protein